MMKAIHTIVLIVPLGLFLFAIGAIQAAEKTNVAATRKTDADVTVQVDRPARILDEKDTFVGETKSDRQMVSGNVLRCWQNGRLLYEMDGFNRVNPATKSMVTVVTRKKGEGVSLINLNEGFCILSDS